jgi:hypothetical protein
MAKVNLVKGDHIVAKKWSGEEFLGVYEYSYQDGSHCVIEVATNKRFNVKHKDFRMANEDEEKEIKKLVKENKTKIRENVEVATKGTQESELEDALAATVESDDED